jgi:hypothetical protein
MWKKEFYLKTLKNLKAFKPANNVGCWFVGVVQND